MANLRALDYPRDKTQILVASDGSTDGTVTFLRQQPDIEVQVLETSVGKNEALNRLLPRATGEILFFTDANTSFDPAAIRATVALFADCRVGVVTGDLRYVGRDPSDSVAQGTGLYWWYENLVKRLESSIGSVLVAAGPLLAVRRGRITMLYPEVANDFHLPMVAAAAGDAVLYSAAFLGSERAASELKDEFWRTARIVSRGTSGCRRLWQAIMLRPLRFWQLVSHKIMRWLIAPILLVLLMSTLGLVSDSPSSIHIVVAIGQVVFYGAALVGGMLHMLGIRAGVLYVPYHFLVLNVAALVGLAQSLTKGAPSIWEKPASARDLGSCDKP
jgi:cellulose synthase/poly-beta-1,6-N-acetylglucosamine synthase-like glycosyltransferase